MNPAIQDTPPQRIKNQTPVGLLDVTVLAGGPGVEREVSLESGRAVAEALRRLGHNVDVHDIDPDNLSALDRAADFVFIALHGEFGEDGTVQAELESRGQRFCGSGSKASRLAMDKVAAKEVFLSHNLPTPPYERVDQASLDSVSSRWQPPVVVKPVASGSSVGTTIAHTNDELLRDVSNLVSTDSCALVEAYIQGRELTVGVVGETALPVCEIRTPRAFYDYHAKYLTDDTNYVFDLDLPKDFLSEVQAMSVKAHHALGCQAVSRVDWMVGGESLTPYLLEINTIPGFTSHSLVPKAAARIGIDFDSLCQRIVDLSWGLDR